MSQFLKYVLATIIYIILSGCTLSHPHLEFDPRATMETLSAAVSISVTTADHGMSGNGFLVYRRPDQFHLVLLSPFGTTLFEVFSHNEQISLLYPGSLTAYVGRIADLPEKGGLQVWRMMRWVMDVAPTNTVGLNGTFERSAEHGVVEKVTYENGLLIEKSTNNGEHVYYSRYAVVDGVPFAAELELRNRQDDRIRIVIDEPKVNIQLDNTAFKPRLEGVKILSLSELQGL